MSSRDLPRLFGRAASRTDELETEPDTLCRLLDQKASLYPGHVPICVDGSESLSYGVWAERSREMAVDLAALPQRQNARFALFFDGLDWSNYAIAYAAVLHAGGTVIHLNGRLSEAEITHRLRECEVSWIIHSKFLRPPREFESISYAVGELPPAGNSARKPALRSRSAIAEIRYTSGTTGAAKGYTVPHANLLFNQTLDTMKQLAQSRSLLVPIWMGDSSSATILTIAITSSNHMVLCLPSDLERMGELIEHQRVESLMLTPNVARQLVEAGWQGRYDLSSVKLLAFASSPLVPACIRKLKRMFPEVQIQVACAQSEASPALLTSVYDDSRPFSIGRPTPTTEIRIVDADERDIAGADMGELWLRTAAPKRLFLQEPEKNRLIEKDGWYRTGDLVRRLENGTIEFFDRKVDSIWRNGVLLSSAHLEAAIAEHPLIREAAVVGYPTHDHQTGVAAFVVLREPAKTGDILQDLAALLPEQERPDRVLVVQDLPRTANGKILKRHLRLLVAHPMLPTSAKGMARATSAGDNGAGAAHADEMTKPAARRSD